jgi:hypothetical protein
VEDGRAYQGFKLGAFQRRVAATIAQIPYIYTAYTNSGVARLLAKYVGNDVARFLSVA